MSPEKANGLKLEVEQIESRGKPSCGTSSTSWLCTCIPLAKKQ